jgi:hypothetical protein
MGQTMYPQLEAGNLVNLNEHRVDPYNERTWESDLPGFKIRRSA